MILKKTTAALCLALLLVIIFILVGAPVQAYVTVSLSAPQSVTVHSEDTWFIIEWQNPKSTEEFAKSSYDNYNGSVSYIIDWRINGGEWHFDKEVPPNDSIFNFYGNYQRSYLHLITA